KIGRQTPYSKTQRLGRPLEKGEVILFQKPILYFLCRHHTIVLFSKPSVAVLGDKTVKSIS
ncbi:MAG: hypothetical protein ACPH4M_06725, partial [Flavobacteriaceae bacterium]